MSKKPGEKIVINVKEYTKENIEYLDLKYLAQELAKDLEIRYTDSLYITEYLFYILKMKMVEGYGWKIPNFATFDIKIAPERRYHNPYNKRWETTEKHEKLKVKPYRNFQQQIRYKEDLPKKPKRHTLHRQDVNRLLKHCSNRSRKDFLGEPRFKYSRYPVERRFPSLGGSKKKYLRRQRFETRTKRKNVFVRQSVHKARQTIREKKKLNNPYRYNFPTDLKKEKENENG